MPKSQSPSPSVPEILLSISFVALLTALCPFFARELVSISFLTLFLLVPLAALALGAGTLTLTIRARRGDSYRQSQTGAAVSRLRRVMLLVSLIASLLAVIIAAFTLGALWWFNRSLKAPVSQPPGEVQTRFFGEPDWRETAVSTVMLPDSSLLISGYGSRNDDPGQGSGFVLKVDPVGRRLKLSRQAGALGRLAIDDGGNILNARIKPFLDSLDAQTTRLALCRLSCDGDSLDQRTYLLPTNASLNCLKSAGEGFYLCGSELWDQAYPYRQASYVMRVDSFGDTLWTRRLTGDATGLAAALTPTRDGGCLTAGWSIADETETAPVFLTRLDSTGSVRWSRSSIKAVEESPLTLAEDSQGNFFLMSDRWNDKDQIEGTITKLTAAGDTLWTRVVTPDGYYMATEMIPWRDGGWLVTGWTPRSESMMKLSREEVKNWDTWFISVVDSEGRIVNAFDGVKCNLAAWGVIRTGEASCVLTGCGTQDETGPWGRILNQDVGLVFYWAVVNGQ